MSGNHQEHIQSEYARLYPREVSDSAASILVSTSPIAISAHLETCLSHLTTVLLVIGASMADEGDAGAIAALEDIRRRHSKQSTSGAYLAYFDLWNNHESTKKVFDSDACVAPEAAPMAMRFAHLWKRLKREHGVPDRWDLDIVNDDLVTSMLESTEPRAALSWETLVMELVECRNKLLHKNLGVQLERVPKRLVAAAQKAVLDVGVVGPPAALLEHFKVATKHEGKQEADGWVYVWRAHASIGSLRTVAKDVNASLLLDGEQWLLERLPSDGPSDPDEAPLCKAIGRWREQGEILKERRDDIEIHERADAWLVAGVVDIGTASGGVAFLPLPTKAVVTVIADGRSAPSCVDLKVILPFEADPGLTDLVTATVRRTLKHLPAAMPAGEQRVVPTGMTGTIELRLPSDANLVHVGARRAVALATARAVARALVDRLPNETQQQVLIDVLGDEWTPNRDYYGWVQADVGKLEDSRVPCPAADLVLVVPSSPGQRRRRSNLRGLKAGAHPDADPSTFGGMANLCTDTAERLNRSECHPLLPIIQPIAEQFGAAGFLVSLDTWVVGLIFQPNDPNRDDVARFLERQRSGQRLPLGWRIIQTSTAATES